MRTDRARVEMALPHYEIGAELGRGGYGVVFAARHRRLGTVRAVKALMLADSGADDEDGAADRFLVEAQVMTELDHPHIVRVHEYAEHGATQLLVMEYLAGGNLTARIRGRVHPGAACAWGMAAADALHAAHQRGIVHRDIKPDNLLFTADDLLKVSDFGIAKLFEGTAASGSAGLVGTPMYVAPEQIIGGRIGPAADVYALGVTLYRLLAGRPLFPSNLGVPGLIYHHLHETPAPVPDAPPAVVDVVLHALAKDPADRPASALDLARELGRAAGHDLGPDWMQRTGVPVRLDHALYRGESRPGRGPAAYGLRPAAYGRRPGPAGGPPGGPVSPRGSLDGGRTGGPPGAVHTPGTAPARPVSGPTHGAAVGVGAEPAAEPGAGAPARQVSRRTVITALGVAAVAATGVAAAIGWWEQPGDQARSNGQPSPEDPAGSTSTPRLVGTLPAGGDDVEAVAFSADGTRLATGSKDDLVRIWDPAAKTLVGSPLRGHYGDIKAVAFSPDRKRLASSGQDESVRLWDLTRGTVIATMTGHTDWVRSVAFSQDGTWLASGGDDGVVRFWDPVTGAVRRSVTTHPDEGASAVAFSRDGTRLAVAGTDGTVRFCDPATGTVVNHTLTMSGGTFFSLAYHPAGTLLATGDEDGVIQLWNPTTGKPDRRLTGHTDRVSSLRFHPGGVLMASASRDGTVRLWNVTTGRQAGRSLGEASSEEYAVAFSPDGSLLASASADDTVKLWSLA